jgi:hypothetical protein
MGRKREQVKPTKVTMRVAGMKMMRTRKMKGPTTTM